MKILFTLADLEIGQEDDQYFAIYDVGAHQVMMRKDEITEKEASLVCSGNLSATEMLLGLQKRLIDQGVNPYISNDSSITQASLERPCAFCAKFPSSLSSLDEVAVSVARHGTLYQCQNCGTYFEVVAEERSPRLITHEEIKKYYPCIAVRQSGQP